MIYELTFTKSRSVYGLSPMTNSLRFLNWESLLLQLDGSGNVRQPCRFRCVKFPAAMMLKYLSERTLICYYHLCACLLLLIQIKSPVYKLSQTFSDMLPLLMVRTGESNEIARHTDGEVTILLNLECIVPSLKKSWKPIPS